MTLPAAETLSFAAIAGSAAAFLALERRFPYDPGQRAFRTGFVTDLLFYGLVQSWLLGVVIGRLIAALDAGSGLSRLRLLADWPLLAQVALFVVSHDLYIYLFHRLQHRSRFLWRFHEAHHSVPEVDWLSGVRSHPVEILVNQTVEFAPIVLLGAAPEVPVLKAAISAIWGMFIHSNLDVRLGRLQLVINGPEMHRWHHTNVPGAHGKNFSTKLAIWDWLFGTALFPDPTRRKAGPYGLGGGPFPEGRWWDGWIRQTLWAFAPSSRRRDESGGGPTLPESRSPSS